jgi:hypothetical protein
MESLEAIGSLIAGVVLRFGIPVGVTALAVWLLKLLDRRWQEEAQSEDLIQVTVKNPGCWDVKNCSDEMKANCKAFQNQDVPCWQLFRDQDGMLRENCLGCDVFRRAPVPLAT